MLFQLIIETMISFFCCSQPNMFSVHWVFSAESGKDALFCSLGDDEVFLVLMPSFLLHSCTTAHQRRPVRGWRQFDPTSWCARLSWRCSESTTRRCVDRPAEGACWPLRPPWSNRGRKLDSAPPSTQVWTCSGCFIQHLKALLGNSPLIPACIIELYFVLFVCTKINIQGEKLSVKKQLVCYRSWNSSNQSYNVFLQAFNKTTKLNYLFVCCGFLVINTVLWYPHVCSYYFKVLDVDHSSQYHLTYSMNPFCHTPTSSVGATLAPVSGLGVLRLHWMKSWSEIHPVNLSWMRLVVHPHQTPKQ